MVSKLCLILYNHSPIQILMAYLKSAHSTLVSRGIPPDDNLCSKNTGTHTHAHAHTHTHKSSDLTVYTLVQLLWVWLFDSL
jgi:hypothetical protein